MIKQRTILYKELSAKLCRGKGALTPQQAKDLLGWKEVETPTDESMLFELEGVEKNVVCTNNLKNRPFSGPLAHKYKQEILRGRWQLNGDDIRIGETGLVLSGQHRLIGLILAQDELEQNPEEYPFWKGKKEVTLETFAHFGISEADEVVNTIDVPRIRSFADCLYRSSLFQELGVAERKAISKLLDATTRFVWHRIGVDDAFGITKTHAETFEFVQKHNSIVTLCKKLSGLDKKHPRGISKYIPLGTACGLAYLMASSNSVRANYLDNPSESSLDFRTIADANTFWERFANPTGLTPLKLLLMGSNWQQEKICWIVQAWLLFISNKDITDKALKLSYHTDDEGQTRLATILTCGGIDIGEPSSVGDE